MRIGLVPARGGSREIPRKNVKLLGDRPLLAWGVGAAKASGCVDRVVVSTEDDEIAAAAESAGAEVLRRPAALAEDDTPTAAVVAHVLDAVGEPEWLLVVQPTEPFVTPDQIRATLELAEELGADSAITVLEVPRNQHPFHVRIERDGFLELERPADHRAHPARQSDPPRYAFGNLYWVRPDAFRRAGTLEAGRVAGHPIDVLSALDLNTPDDWALAEAAVAAGLVKPW